MTLRHTFFKALLHTATLGGYIWRGLSCSHVTRISRHTLPLSGMQPGETIKILHMSDFHASPHVPLENISKAVTLGLACKPDIICVTGDFITSRIYQAHAYKKILQRLSDFAPTFACLGNHDGGPWSAQGLGYDTQPGLMQLLAQSGVICLVNQTSVLRLRSTELEITGLGDLWSQQSCPAIAFCNDCTHTTVKIVLAHNPDTVKIIDTYPWDLLLCGHTHGGQVILPYIGAPYLPIKNRAYIHGLHQHSERYVHISAGVGSLFGIRINCPPEISLLVLQRDPHAQSRAKFLSSNLDITNFKHRHAHTTALM